MTKPTLPIDAHVPRVLETLEAQGACVVTAEPGAGKTTRVPPALLSLPSLGNREIWVLQPRRIAAKLAALRVAEEMSWSSPRSGGASLDSAVGWHFRFEKQGGAGVRLWFMTDGMLLPLARTDPVLSRVGAVVLDEFHERSVALDVAFAYLRLLRATTRPDLKILVMSATLDAQAVAAALGDCPVVDSPGRVHPVSVEYLPQPQEKDLSDKVRGAVRSILAREPGGDILVFLPGVGEIRRAQSALSNIDADVLPLYGDLPVAEQQRVLAPSPRRKVILATNVAETSITVPGVRAVVDSGLTRQERVSPWSGVGHLVTVPASRASATQRAGRAGRVQEGLCVRLYDRFDFEHRAAFDVPELQRTDLSGVVLDLAAMGVADPAAFPWLEPPPVAALQEARTLLKRLGALTPEGGLTEMGRGMAAWPVAPRLARFLVAVGEATKDAKTRQAACRMAALIGEEKAEGQDLLHELERYRPEGGAKRLVERLEQMLGVSGGGTGRLDSRAESVLSKALLAGYPDRVGRLRDGEGKERRHGIGRARELVLCGGGSAQAADDVLTRAHRFFVVVEAQGTGNAPRGREEPGARTQVKARSLVPIEANWLLDLFPGEVSEEDAVEWDADAERVEGKRLLKYGQVVLDEGPLGAGTGGEAVSQLLLKQARSAGLRAWCDPDEAVAFIGRARFVASRTEGFPSFKDEELDAILSALCEGKRSFKQLREAGGVAALRGALTPAQASLMERLAPARVTLKKGRGLEVHYEEGKPPWCESRLQDFFGMREGPKVADGAVPLTLHLLAPNHRAVQVTSDLAGFWKNHYPQVRKELSRRYPKHHWPENPC